jgi:hypothetical protein
MPRRMGRPSLLGSMARTAVVAGTATATVGAVSGHQQKKAAASQAQAADAQADAQQQAQIDQLQQQVAAQQAPAAPAPGSALDDQLVQIQKLSSMKDQGLLTEEEFAAKKAQILGL